MNPKSIFFNLYSFCPVLRKATHKSYPSNLTAEQWIFIARYLPVEKSGQRTCPHVRPRSTNLQAVLNAIFYVLCSGCSWRMLPGDFPAWQTVAAPTGADRRKTTGEATASRAILDDGALMVLGLEFIAT